MSRRALGIVVAAVLAPALASAKPKPLAATVTCSTVDEAAQRAPIDGSKRKPLGKTVHHVECLVRSTDTRLADRSATPSGRSTHGATKDQHEDAAVEFVADNAEGKIHKRTYMLAFDSDKWDRCEDVDLELAIKDGDGAALWSKTILVGGGCPKPPAPKPQK